MSKTIVAISDTHLREFDVPNGDILIHCGDSLMRGDVTEMMKFSKWWNSLPHPVKIFVPGNHDWLFSRNYPLARSMLENTHTLIDKTIKIEGIKVHGSPRTPEFCGWAFMHNDLPSDNIYDDENNLGKYFDLIPEGLDILISHGPPYGVLDDAPSGPHVGSKELRKAIERAKPKYVLAGHIHCARFQGPNGDGIDYIGESEIINCSNVNEQYRQEYAPRIIVL